jgi:SAM-dependent methyltransferase
VAGPVPDFSPLAERYARARPTYPDELYAWLAGLLDRRDLAWDCATGNGQAARGLAPHFARVVATDTSAEQLRHAPGHPRIEYRRAPAESSGLTDATVDLATVAAALHWFDHAAFGRELRRVVRPGGVFAAWSYHAGRVEPPFDELFRRLYWDLLHPFFAAGARHVDASYESIELPGEAVPAPPFRVRVTWNRRQLLDYVDSWSAVAGFTAARGHHPAREVGAELDRLFPDPEAPRELSMPLVLRVRRL